MAGRMRRRTIAAIVLLVLVLAIDAVLVWRRGRYVEETARLRAGMTELERKRTDAIIEAEANEASVMVELMRRQAAGDDALHLAVNIDSSYVALDRGAARLRVMPARIGAAQVVGSPPDTSRVTVPLGKRTVERVLGATDAHPLPAWLWADRGEAVPAERAAVGWTGSHAIVTSGGTLIYALPTQGPLADSSYVMPGTVRVSASDLAAIRENLTRGMTVYFY